MSGLTLDSLSTLEAADIFPKLSLSLHFLAIVAVVTPAVTFLVFSESRYVNALLYLISIVVVTIMEIVLGGLVITQIGHTAVGATIVSFGGLGVLLIVLTLVIFRMNKDMKLQ
nr:hypothetical transcript [Hymenolepis microstoma]